MYISSDYILLIYPAILIGITFYKSAIYKGTEFSTQMWNRDQAKMIQAVACVGVILHHLTQSITSYGEAYRGPITILSSMGILFTSVFFFFTGYGLIISVLDNPDYLKTFLRHRLSIVLVPFFTANTVCVILRIFYKHIPTNFVDTIRAILGFTLLNGNGWYIVEVFYLYLIFYVLFRCIKKKDVAIIILCSASVIMMCYSYRLGHDYSDIGDRPFYGEWWYNSTIVFSMGVIFARFRNNIVSFIKRHYKIVVVVTFFAFIISFKIEEHVLKTRGYYRESITIDGISNAFVTLISQMILCVICTFFVLLINMKISIGNRALKGISIVATEIFLIHGIFINTIFDFTHTSAFLRYAIVLVCSVPAGAVMHCINVLLYKILGNHKTVKHSFTKEEALENERRVEHRARLIKFVIIWGLVTVIIMLSAGYLYRTLIRTYYECRSEINELKKSQVGDEVYFGRYDTTYSLPGKERVSWIVLKKDSGKLMLISKEGLAGSVYNREHEAVDWNESYIRGYLNDDMYDELFSRSEKRYIMKNPDNDDYITLLTIGEAKSFFENDVERQLKITDVARENGTNINNYSKVKFWDEKGYRSSWWWLRGEQENITAPIVTVDGNILEYIKYVNKPKGAIRPVIWVLTQENIAD